MLACSIPLRNVALIAAFACSTPMTSTAQRIDRARLWRVARAFAPHSLHDDVESLAVSELFDAGYRLLLLDVDGTLLTHGDATVPESVQAWVRDAKATGLALCIISNTRRPARLAKIAEALDVPYLIGQGKDKKPSPSLYRKALERFGHEAREALMVGDQLFTDCWGANRAGIDSVWLTPRSRREFIGTRLLVRPLEALVLGHVRRRICP